ncbi:hypothetical protein PC128_g22489 [Phytophthora cactorum]|nr:hypothetical protein PC128_g22489 [Phytophthora cactorum]
MLGFAPGRVRKVDDVPRAAWDVVEVNNVTKQSGFSMDSHYRKKLMKLTQDQREKAYGGRRGKSLDVKSIT